MIVEAGVNSLGLVEDLVGVEQTPPSHGRCNVCRWQSIFGPGCQDHESVGVFYGPKRSGRNGKLWMGGGTWWNYRIVHAQPDIL